MPLFLCSVPRGIPRFLFLLFPGIGCRLFFVLCPSLYLGPCFYSAGCYPAFSYVFSPASDAGVLPPLWRGRVFPFTVQSRDHLATITDIYVPSFLRPVRGSLAPRLLLSIPRHSMPAFILSIVPWRIALTWQFEREEPRGAMLRPRLLSGISRILARAITQTTLPFLTGLFHSHPRFYSPGMGSEPLLISPVVPPNPTLAQIIVCGIIST